MCLETLVYSGLKDDPKNVEGWDKRTIDYVQKFKSKVCSNIRSIAASRARLLQTADVEDVYCDLIMYLYNADDYSIEKGYERSSSGQLVPLEGYVFSLTKYCVYRYLTNMYDKEKVEITIVKADENSDKEWNLYDNIKDESVEEVLDKALCNIKDLCDESTGDRYRIGADIYMIVYVRLLTTIHNKKYAYKSMLKLLGVPDNLRVEDKENKHIGLMLDFIKAISVSGEEESLKEIGRHVYQRQLIDIAIAAF